MSGRGFEFRTKSGSLYYYDDSSGCVTVVEEIAEGISRDETAKSPITITPLSASPEVWVEADHHREVTEIKPYLQSDLESDGYKQLILIVTEECNLRCRYCIYSGNYENERTHQASYMTWRVAKEAINWYLHRCLKVKERNPRRIPIIGFYGGEPLLAFPLIQQAVTYARKLYVGEIHFHMTTNGTLLSGEVADFMADNRFGITITLNGPETEHDRMRIFSDGSGSFRIIWQNLLKLREKYSDYYEEKCTLAVDYDAGSDLNLVTSFFEDYKGILPNTTRVSLVSPYFTKWHEQYSVEQKHKLGASMEALKQRYFSEMIKWKKTSPFLEALVGTSYEQILLRPQGSLIRPSYLPYTATCTPGEKIAVDPRGNFHCCEKMNYHFPIGNIDTGLDLESIVKMLDMYRREICAACFDCPITRLCSICYATVAGVGKFERNPPDLCHILQTDVRESFAELWSLFEAGVKESDILGARSKVLPDF